MGYGISERYAGEESVTDGITRISGMGCFFAKMASLLLIVSWRTGFSLRRLWSSCLLFRHPAYVGDFIAFLLVSGILKMMDMYEYL